MDTSEASQEWSTIAKPYVEVFMPRFLPLYRHIEEIVLRELKLRRGGQVLDFGTGPGEPALVVAQGIGAAAPDLPTVRLVAADFAQGMVAVGRQRWQQMTAEQPQLAKTVDVTFASTHSLTQHADTFDVIMSSLVLPYAPSRLDMLRELSQMLKRGGVLVTSHWPHPSTVPFLSVLKLVNAYMSGGSRTSVADLEDDASFACWPEAQLRSDIEDRTTELRIVEWRTVDLPMEFPNVTTLLSFSDTADWFKDPARRSKAEQKAVSILKQSFGIDARPDEPLRLQNKVIVVVSQRQ
ncbi:hypothetical protein RI367_000050 [Sorochytrium milnesiophthora]